jgi:hypothetical protein
MNYTQRPAFNDAIAEVRNEMLRLQVRIDEYNKAIENRYHEWNAAPRERGAIRRASLDLSAALVKLRKVKL